MKRHACLWLAAAALAALPAPLRGQEASVRAEVDATKLGVSDQVQLTITVEGRGELAQDITLPPLKNLRLLGGPSVSQQVSFDNGSISQSRAYTYVLQPLAPGKAEIGAAQVKLAGGVKTTAPIELEVVPGSVRPRQARPQSPFGDEDPFESFFGRRRPRTEPKVQAVAVASRTRLHVGEPVLVTYFVYTQASLADVRPEAPAYPGFWSEDLEQPKGNIHGERASLEGESYTRFAVVRKLLFPTKSGPLTIPSLSFRLALARLSVFDGGPGGVERATQPLALTVEPLPSEPGFSGAVGEFEVKASLDRPAIPLGEAATLRFTVQGSGNLKWVDHAPELNIPGAKLYPPQTKSDLKVGPEGIKGSKTWEFVVVPETSGALSIPPLAFSYFAPSAGVVKKTQTAALTLEVQGAGAAASGGVASPLAIPVAPRGTGLALRSDLDLPGRRLPALGAASVLVAWTLLLLLHGAIGAAALAAERRRAASGRPAARGDVRGALGELERARRGGLTKEQAAALIEHTLHAVFGPAAENGGPPAGEREKAIHDVLQRVQFIRYAPQLGDYSETIREVAAQAADVVRRWA